MNNLKFIILLFLLSFVTEVRSQCVGIQSGVLNPPPPPTGYSSGTAVNVCYTMQGWNGTTIESNWLEGFVVTLGSGWVNYLQSGPPANCDGGGGEWLWRNSITSSETGISVGPGWFFEAPSGGPTDQNPGNDWGDFGTTCTWTFCFTVTVNSACTPQNLLIQVTAGADGTWGSWINNACPTVPFIIYNGISNVQSLSSLGPITHD
jgi:hypothetical protein